MTKREAHKQIIKNIVNDLEAGRFTKQVSGDSSTADTERLRAAELAIAQELRRRHALADPE